DRVGARGGVGGRLDRRREREILAACQRVEGRGQARERDPGRRVGLDTGRGRPRGRGRRERVGRRAPYEALDLRGKVAGRVDRRTAGGRGELVVTRLRNGGKRRVVVVYGRGPRATVLQNDDSR